MTPEMVRYRVHCEACCYRGDLNGSGAVTYVNAVISNVEPVELSCAIEVCGTVVSTYCRTIIKLCTRIDGFVAHEVIPIIT